MSDKPKIYIAAPVGQQTMVALLAMYLTMHGLEPVGVWYDEPNVGYDSNTPDSWREKSVMDVQGVRDCDALIILAVEGSRGGMFTEYGVALGLGKKLFVVGDYKSVMLFHPDAQRLSWPKTRQDWRDTFKVIFGALQR